MRDYVQKPNEGSLFKNDKKKGETDRDYNGSLIARCAQCGHDTPFWLSAWLNIAKSTGKKWMRLAMEVREPQAPDQTQTQAPSQDEIPF